MVGDQTLVPGGSAITVDGTMVSLEPAATALVVGTSTEGLGGFIVSGFGGGSAGGVPTSTVAGTVFRGETGGLRVRRRGWMWGLGLGWVVMIVGVC